MMASRMRGLVGLPYECISSICSWLPDDDLLTVRLVCMRLHGPATNWLKSSMILVHDREAVEGFLTMLKIPEDAGLIRHIKFYTFQEWSHDMDRDGWHNDDSLDWQDPSYDHLMGNDDYDYDDGRDQECSPSDGGSYDYGFDILAWASNFGERRHFHTFEMPPSAVSTSDADDTDATQHSYSGDDLEKDEEGTEASPRAGDLVDGADHDADEGDQDDEDTHDNADDQAKLDDRHNDGDEDERSEYYDRHVDCLHESDSLVHVRSAHEGFRRCLSKLDLLPRLRSVTIEFTKACVCHRGMEDEVPEPPYSRAEKLTAFFDAFLALKISTLAVRNLQTYPGEDLSKSEGMQTVLSNLHELELATVQGLGRFHIGPEIDCSDLRDFYPFFETHWLAPLGVNLSRLTLSHEKHWGLLPRDFTPNLSHLPALDYLCLGKYTFGHEDHADWILALSSLRHLRLKDCAIASYIHLRAEQIPKLGTSTRDWNQTYSSMHDGREWLEFSYPVRWASIFDKIRERLSLSTFRLSFSNPTPFCEPRPTHPQRTHAIRHFARRYVAFNSWAERARSWYFPCEPNGDIELFRRTDEPEYDQDWSSNVSEGDKSNSSESGKAGRYLSRKVFYANRHIETFEEDAAALQRLQDAIELSESQKPYNRPIV